MNIERLFENRILERAVRSKRHDVKKRTRKFNTVRSNADREMVTCCQDPMSPCEYCWMWRKNFETWRVAIRIPVTQTPNSASHETPGVLWNPKFHCRVHKSPPIPRLCVTFPNKLVLNGEELLAPHSTPKLRNTPCRLSVTAYSIHSQLPSTSGGCLRHPQPENVPGDIDPHNSTK
jgi:hypothetical protein